MTRRAGDLLLGLLYPSRCRLCGGELGPGARYFCGACKDAVTRLDGPFCSVCGRPFTSGSGRPHPCGDCMAKPPPYDRAAAPLLYEGAAVEAIHLFKYGGLRGLAGFLGGFVQEGASLFPDAEVVAPVPLHKRRLRQRGFNQSLLLARRAASSMGAPLSIDGLARIRYTRPQVSLGPAEREVNVKGAFAAVRPGEFRGKRVLLVDDVYTTGATARECARALKKAGAEAVYVLTVARGA